MEVTKLALVLGTVSYVLGQSVSPAALPSVRIDTTYQAPTGKSTLLGAGSDLQAALNAAQPGDELVLQAGVTWVGNYTLPAKACSPMVAIRTSALSSFPEGVRAAPSQVGSMASILAPSMAPAISAAPGACGYQLVGIEASVQSAAIGSWGLVMLGSGSETAAQLPANIFIERSWIHGTPTCNCKRGVQINGVNLAVVDSTITDIHYQGLDSQAVTGWAGPGPFKIVNNELQAGSEIVAFGGAKPSIVGTIPSDIEIRRNHITRPTSWMNAGWLVKNLFELKNAQRVLFDSNIAEYNWFEGQFGYAILFQGFTSDSGDWAIVSDVTVTNNIIRHSANGFNFCGGCYLSPTAPAGSKTTRIYIANNLLDDIGNPAYTASQTPYGVPLQFIANTSNVMVDHNTFIDVGNEAATLLDGSPSSGISLTSNILGFGYYGIYGSGVGDGTAATNQFLPGSVINGNVFAARSTSSTSPYPAGNSFPSSWTALQFTNFNNGSGGDYTLTAQSPYFSTGVGGSTPGANITTVNANTANVINGALPAVTISITSPTNSPTFTTSAGLINLSGTASSNAGILTVTWATSAGASGTAQGTTNWAINGLALTPGTTTVTLTAHDATSKVGSTSISITYSSSDTFPPSISISAPTSSPTYTSTSSIINLSGSASDNVGVTSVTWATSAGSSGSANGTTSWALNGLVIPSGTTTITLTAHDAAGNTANAMLTVTYSAPDSTPPTVIVTTPTSAGSFVTTTNSIVLGGTASDNIGVSKVDWVTDQGGSGIATGTTSWLTSRIPLAGGLTHITVTAHDAAGNAASSTLAVTYNPQDTTPPAISITSPTSASTFSTSTVSINLAGTASDNVGVQQVTWVTDHGASGIAAGTTSWTISGLALPAGSTTITVTAGDAAGNATSAALIVTSTPSDTTLPTINITTPTSAGTYTTSSTAIGLAGTAADNVGVTQVTWVTDLGGSGVASGTTSWTIPPITLVSGLNRISVSAHDAAGNLATAALVVTYNATTGSISITSPTVDSTFQTTQNSVSLGGTASSSITQVTWVSNKGAQGSAIGTNAWTANAIPLQNGNNQITVIGRDASGNQSSTAITVKYSHPTISTSLPPGKAGKLYSYPLVVNGIPPYSWSAGNLPSGLQLTGSGTITGTPSTTGTFTMTVTVTDSIGAAASATINFQVDSWLSLVSGASLAPGPVAPESMVTAFGSQLATATQSATESSLPTNLAGTTVMIRDVNGVDRPASLHYVSPTQINFTIPAASALGPAVASVYNGSQLIVTSGLYIADRAPGLFFMNQDGLAAAGLVRVQGNNVSYEPAVQLDPATNQFAAIPIDLGPDTDQVYLTLYGTGFRRRSDLYAVNLFIGQLLVPVTYAGPAGTIDGLDIVNALLPRELTGAGNVPVSLMVNGITANTVRVDIK